MLSSKWTFNATSSKKLIATQKNELNKNLQSELQVAYFV